MPDIDYAMKHGVPRTEILKFLSEVGIQVDMGYFNIVRTRFKAKKLKQEQSQIKNGPKIIPEPIEFNDMAAAQEKSENTLKITGLKKIGIPDSVSTTNASAKRFRNQFVDLDAYSKLAPKK